MTHTLTIRNATHSDAPRLAELSAMLGYPQPPERLAATLARVLGRSGEVVLVADLGHGQAIGWLHGAEQELLETGRSCEILGLVVDASHRGVGAGRKLVDAIESWARDRGIESVSVRSNVVRVEAHPFYLRMGFDRVKTQHAYRKSVSPTS